jgi:hypothetical protein
MRLVDGKQGQSPRRKQVKTPRGGQSLRGDIKKLESVLPNCTFNVGRLSGRKARVQSSSAVS